MSIEFSEIRNEIEAIIAKVEKHHQQLENDKTSLQLKSLKKESLLTEEKQSNKFKYGLLNHQKLMEEALFDAINYFDKACPYCKKNLYEGNIRKKIEIDHFFPIAKGGQDYPWNILPTCKDCNRKKKDLMPYDFLEVDIYSECKSYLEKILHEITNHHEDKLQKGEIVSTLVRKLAFKEIDLAYFIRTIYELYDYADLPIEVMTINRLQSKINDSTEKEISAKQMFLTIYNENKRYNKMQLSNMLGVSRSTLYNWVKEFENK